MRRLAILILLLATACAIDPRPFKGPNGRQAYYMECSGMGRTLQQCYEMAGQVCAKGYQIVNQTSGVVAVRGVAAPEYTLAIECR